jgi:hypothetical protein
MKFWWQCAKIVHTHDLERQGGGDLQMDQRFSLATIKSYHMVIITTQAHFTTMVTQTELE